MVTLTTSSLIFFQTEKKKNLRHSDKIVSGRTVHQHQPVDAHFHVSDKKWYLFPYLIFYSGALPTMFSVTFERGVSALPKRTNNILRTFWNCVAARVKALQVALSSTDKQPLSRRVKRKTCDITPIVWPKHISPSRLASRKAGTPAALLLLLKSPHLRFSHIFHS